MQHVPGLNLVSIYIFAVIACSTYQCRIRILRTSSGSRPECAGHVGIRLSMIRATSLAAANTAPLISACVRCALVMHMLATQLLGLLGGRDASEPCWKPIHRLSARQRANVVAKVVDLESNSLFWHPALFAPQELVHAQDTIRHGNAGHRLMAEGILPEVTRWVGVAKLNKLSSHGSMPTRTILQSPGNSSLTIPVAANQNTPSYTHG